MEWLQAEVHPCSQTIVGIGKGEVGVIVNRRSALPHRRHGGCNSGEARQ